MPLNLAGGNTVSVYTCTVDACIQPGARRIQHRKCKASQESHRQRYLSQYINKPTLICGVVCTFAYNGVYVVSVYNYVGLLLYKR